MASRYMSKVARFTTGQVFMKVTVILLKCQELDLWATTSLED